MEERKYYFAFVRTKWTSYGLDKLLISSDENEFQVVLDVHPLEWQIEFNEEHFMMPLEVEDGGYMTQTMKVMSWQKISVEEYKKFKDIINE